MIPLFDLHCDTFSKIYKNNCTFSSPSLHISEDKIGIFHPYVQICAIWSDCLYGDEDAYLKYKENIAYLDELNMKFNNFANFVDYPSFVLAVEDARILNYKLQRLDDLYTDGVRVLTLCWKGSSCIGGGWDTALPLTDFGVSVVKKCYEKGIIVDLSHSSLQVQSQAIKLAQDWGKIPIYSHSNSFSICKHKRNITDSFFTEVSSIGGLVGISLCSEHLCKGENANISWILKHIYHFLCLGGENTVSLGCDFDGISSLPLGISNITDLKKLYDAICTEFGLDIANNIFYYNALNFFKKIV